MSPADFDSSWNSLILPSTVCNRFHILKIQLSSVNVIPAPRDKPLLPMAPALLDRLPINGEFLEEEPTLFYYCSLFPDNLWYQSRISSLDISALSTSYRDPFLSCSIIINRTVCNYPIYTLLKPE